MIRRFWRDESGPEMVEWAVVTVILLSLTVVAMIMLKDELLNFLSSIFDRLEEVPPDSFITQP